MEIEDTQWAFLAGALDCWLDHVRVRYVTDNEDTPQGHRRFHGFEVFLPRDGSIDDLRRLRCSVEVVSIMLWVDPEAWKFLEKERLDDYDDDDVGEFHTSFNVSDYDPATLVPKIMFHDGFVRYDDNLDVPLEERVQLLQSMLGDVHETDDVLEVKTKISDLCGPDKKLDDIKIPVGLTLNASSPDSPQAVAGILQEFQASQEDGDRVFPS